MFADSPDRPAIDEICSRLQYFPEIADESDQAALPDSVAVVPAVIGLLLASDAATTFSEKPLEAFKLIPRGWLEGKIHQSSAPKTSNVIFKSTPNSAACRVNTANSLSSGSANAASPSSGKGCASRPLSLRISRL